VECKSGADAGCAGVAAVTVELARSDLRITNFGGGIQRENFQEVDTADGSSRTVLWIKGSGGDIGSIQRSGFATSSGKLHALEGRYRGVEHEDEMVGMYPLFYVGNNSVATSIDTPLHGFLPFAHIDHLHPDWGIAAAAAANAREDARVNERFGHKLICCHGSGPDFELE